MHKGVPQGSILLSNMFADDIAFYADGKSATPVAKSLTIDLNQIADWCDLNGLSFNMNKYFELKDSWGTGCP